MHELLAKPSCNVKVHPLIGNPQELRRTFEQVIWPSDLLLNNRILGEEFLTIILLQRLELVHLEQ